MLHLNLRHFLILVTVQDLQKNNNRVTTKKIHNFFSIKHKITLTDKELEDTREDLIREKYLEMFHGQDGHIYLITAEGEEIINKFLVYVLSTIDKGEAIVRSF